MRRIDEIQADEDALRTKAARIEGEIAALTGRVVAEGRTEMTAGEQQKLDRWKAGTAKLETEKAALDEEHRDAVYRFASRPGAREDIGEATGPVTRSYDPTPGVEQAHRTIDAAHRSHLLPDHAAETATRLIEQGPAHERTLAARWATVTGSPAYLRAFQKLLGNPLQGHLLWDGEELDAYQRVAALQSEMRAMSLTDAAGGYMVPFTLDPSIILTSAGTINPLRRISRIVTTVSDAWNGVSSAGVTASWDAEASEVSDDAPTLAPPSVPIYTARAFVPYSFEVGLDAVGFAQEISRLLVDGVDVLEAKAFTTGAGGTEPFGIITAIAGTASEVNAATDDVFALADVYTLQAALPPRFSANAQWCANLAIINKIAQFESTAGARLFPEVGDGQLLRKPLNEASDMDGTITTSGAVSNLILLYGDFRNYVIADRIGSTIELVPHLFHTANNRPSGQRGLLLWKRTGADSVNDNAFRLLDVASAA